MTTEQFEALLQKPEGPTLDFKRTNYDLTDEVAGLILVKDILAMANTPRTEKSHIIVGVDKLPDGSILLQGLDNHPDDADLQLQFDGRVSPKPHFRYYPLDYKGKTFGIFEISIPDKGPCVSLVTKKNILTRQTIYFRRGSANYRAEDYEDMLFVTDWYKNRKGFVSLSKDDNPSWDSFLKQAHNFSETREYILFTTPCRQDQIINLEALGYVPWLGVVDFDPNSDISGLLNASKGIIEQHRSLHLVVGNEHPTINPGSGVHWYFARGLTGREGTVSSELWREWLKTHGITLTHQLQRIAKACSPTLITCVALWYDPSLVRFLQTSIESAIGAFGDRIDFIIATDDPSSVQNIASESEATIVEISLHHLCSGLSARFGQETLLLEDAPTFPSKSGAPVPVPVKDLPWLEEEIETLHLGSGKTLLPTERKLGFDFLRGSEIIWRELSLDYDVKRDIQPKIERSVRSSLENRHTVRINLYHAPGAGGTTLARRLLWNLHYYYPCAILKRTTPDETAERLYRITSLTELPILLLVDGSSIADRQIDQLYERLRSRNIPAVLLLVQRRFSETIPGERAFYLKTELSKDEASRFVHIYGRQVPDREGDLMSLLQNNDSRFRSAFYFGLYTFQKDFRGLESYVDARLEALSSNQKRVIESIALVHHYAQRSIPAQVFADLLGIPPKRQVKLRSLLTPEAIELLVEEERNSWRTAHDLIATEVLQQILWPSSPDRRLWKQMLSDRSVKFIDLCRGTDPGPSEEILEIMRRVFIYRDNTELLGTERSASNRFAQLIEDIPSKEGSLQVLRHLTVLYPYESHFWAHLGRYLSIEMGHYLDARDAIDHSIKFSETEDALLYHMKGMVLRSEVYNMMNNLSDLSDIIKLAEESALAFAKAREISPDDEHGYISDIQLRTKLLDYAGRKNDSQTVQHFYSHLAPPFLRESFEVAEDLLEQIRRNREGQGSSYYEENCRAELDALYGNHSQALQIWDSLLSRQDVYKPPVRRQIVWTYFARSGRSWNSISTREADRMVGLLDDNLEEEPNSNVNLRLWVQAIRKASVPPNIEQTIERISYWYSNSESLEAVYYLYIMYTLEAIKGSALSRKNFVRFVEECQQKARFRQNRTKSYEWLGNGTGIQQLTHQSQLGEWNREIEFWENADPLKRMKGRISKYNSPQAGEIEIDGGLPAFFVPARSNHTRRDINALITCYIGFSYDGLRAWEVRDANSEDVQKN